MGGLHLCPSTIPGQIVSTLQSAENHSSLALHFQCGFFDERHNYKRVRNTQTQCHRFPAQQTPGGHLSSLRLLIWSFLFLISPSCCCFFWLLPYLLITHWPFWCQTLLSPVANFRCYYPSSDCKVAKCSTSQNVGQEYIWLSTICSHRQLVVHPFSLNANLYFHTL